ncbi:hypothetical protein Taro_049729 [Colocasia esculenta]|uniref:CCHC-type domain-containing protein n=1 Tax=Colocasia esculenta TaxID=4460 RepID=A0A843XBM6_COLES|nr:hypothetical protein [Colocasia esculenta]
MSVAEYEAQFARLAVYAPHLVGTEILKVNRFMDGLRPMFIEKLGPHNIQTYTEMVQRAQLVEDTMAKVEGMRGKDISKSTFIKRGAVDTTRTFPNNNNNNYNNKRPTTGKVYSMEKKIKVEETTMVEYCNFCNKPGHRAEECWKKVGACLRCGSRDHRLPNCPMLRNQAGRNQAVVKRQGCVNAITPAELPELLVAEELWNDHKKLIFFPVASTATCIDSHLEVDQRVIIMVRGLLHETTFQVALGFYV